MSELSPQAQAAANTFRALCAELTAWAEKTSAHYFQPPDVLLRARAALSDEPPEPAPPADGEVAELVAWLRSNALTVKKASGNPANGARQRMNRAAELLERQALVPVSVSERPWEREGWCDVEGRFWAEHISRSGVASWRCAAASDLGGWAVRCLPAHALPVPEVDE